MKLKIIMLMSLIMFGTMLWIVSSFLEERKTIPREQNEEVLEEVINLKASGWLMDTSLADVDASFLGEAQFDYSGTSIECAGDVNNDGYDDFIIGVVNNDEGPGDSVGQTYLILGKASGWSMDVSLANADASFIGEADEDRSGSSIAGVGDVNNDGYDDFIIGASWNSDGAYRAGQTYLILGKASGWSMDVSLANADASFLGEAVSDMSGSVVSGAGDVNNDGYDDFIIGAYWNDEGPGTYAGQTYLILGKASGWSMDLSLANVDASFIGESEEDYSGSSLAGAGDVNNDGYDDFLIGASRNNEGPGDDAGQSYLILGKASGWSMDTSLMLASASFIGEAGEDYSGYVAGAGDVNNDGYDDFLIGSSSNDEGPGDDAGQTYLILGKASGWGKDKSLANADASFIGEAEEDYSGSVAGAGDVNNDGYDDFLIGASRNNEGPGDDAGQCYLIFGKTSGWSMDVSLANADASFIGEADDDRAGYVAGAGDVNNDGYDDFLIGAKYNEEGNYAAGQIYLIFGHLPPRPFSLASPDAGSPDVDGHFNLNWGTSEGADNYTVYWDTTPFTKYTGAQNILIDELYVFTTPFSTSQEGTYYFRVCAKNGTGETYSDTSYLQIVVDLPPPGSFSLTSPDAGSPDVDGQFTLNWGISEGANNYTVYWDTTSFTTYTGSQNILIDELYVFTTPFSTSQEGTYYFRVCAKNGTGETYSDTSCLQIVVDLPPPGTFSLTSSDAGSPDNDGQFILNWGISEGADNYTVYWDTTPFTTYTGSQNILIDELNVFSTPFSASEEGTYYFRVCAKNGTGERYSDLGTFQVEVQFKSTTTDDDDNGDDDRGEVPGNDLILLIGVFGTLSAIGGISLTLLIKKRKQSSSRIVPESIGMKSNVSKSQYYKNDSMLGGISQVNEIPQPYYPPKSLRLNVYCASCNAPDSITREGFYHFTCNQCGYKFFNVGYFCRNCNRIYPLSRDDFLKLQETESLRCYECNNVMELSRSG